MELNNIRRHHKKHVSFTLWGWLFLIPFFAIFIWLQAVPLGKTFYYAFFDYYKLSSGKMTPLTYVGWANFFSADPEVVSLFGPGGAPEIGYRSIYFFNHIIGKWYMPDVIYYLINTIIIWILGFVPQMIVSLSLAVWFTDSRLKLKGLRFWKTVMYLPNLIMAAAFGLLFQLLFTSSGPIVQMLQAMGVLHSEYDFGSMEFWTRFIIALINFLSWFGNTTLLLMSGVMGIDNSVFESASLDGASATKTFWKITFPLLKPIFLYVLITSLIGGVQLYDVAYMFTKGQGGQAYSSKTIFMYLFDLVQSCNYGLSGALSVFIFLITASLSMTIFYVNNGHKNPEKECRRAQAKRYRVYASCPDTIDEIKRHQSVATVAKEVR
jgi:multiple sugar transport system permease protein